MRLLIAEAPQRRHLGTSSQPRVFRHDGRGVARSHEKNIERQSAFWTCRQEFALLSGKIKRTKWLMDEHGPAGSADEPWNRNASAMCRELVTALSTAHAIRRAAAVELRPAFSEAEQR